jgi:hypothetical protein
VKTDVAKTKILNQNPITTATGFSHGEPVSYINRGI